jgi:DNA-binding response OmpR family regulator
MKGKPNLLVVDDVPEYLRSLELVLRAHYSVEAAISAIDAKAKIEKHQPDAAIVDVCLDETVEYDRSGLSLVKWLKARSAQLPIVVMSALDDASIPEETMKAGADAFLKKPINLSELRRILDSLIRECKKDPKLDG